MALLTDMDLRVCICVGYSLPLKFFETNCYKVNVFAKVIMFWLCVYRYVYLYK